MNGNSKTDEFLDAATSGLRKDVELQLDVKAELRSHLEEYQHEAESRGLAPEAAADEAVRAMGTPVEIADGLERANRHRMRLRTLVRIAVQWLLAPLAIAIAFLTTDWGSLMIIQTAQVFGCGFQVPDILMVQRKFSPDENLILNGDTTKPTPLAQQKAIFDKCPQNKVYMHNYMTHLLNKSYEFGPTPETRNKKLSEEIIKLRSLDPDNARFDYILASLLLEQAAEIKSVRTTGTNGKPKDTYDVLIKDRAKLDEAMSHFKAGLAKPEWRRYTREMAVEQLNIMGEPTSFLEQISQIDLLAGLMLPDMQHLRNLERATIFYSELMAKEGHRDEADLFLNAHRKLVPQINKDSFTLIDIFVVSAIANLAAERVPEIYESIGDKVAAEKARKEATALAAPVKNWKDKKDKDAKVPAGTLKTFDMDLKLHGGILAGMLLPALGEYPTREELAPGRHLDYVVAEGFALIFLSLVLFILILFSVLAGMHYRWIRGGGAGILLLLPGIGEVVRMMVYGVLLPLTGYYLITRWLPWCGWDLNIFMRFSSFISQILALFLVMLVSIVATARSIVRRRCQELLLPVPPPMTSFWKIAWCSLISFFAIVSIMPDLCINNDTYGLIQILTTTGLAVLTVLALIVHGIYCDIRRGKTFAAYYGSLFRTLLPVLALSLILVNICSRPYLRMEEKRLLARDTLMRPNANAGFTSLELRVTQRLKGEIQQASESISHDAK
ncbi:MAG TPA: hypothetical protein DCZ94_11035 [Lentisphaeria bacterium]|nr:MAG: hypothetical protein A2X48_06915 [Lentisphaerae bacterium GWF2_49_21]HBC87479.1 hypothetical protein [Lentisphaeria bacterium]